MKKAILEKIQKNSRDMELTVHSIKGEVEKLSPHGRNYLDDIKRHLEDLEKFELEQERLFKEYKEEE